MNRKFFILSISLICLFGQSKTKSSDGDTLRYIFEPDSLTLKVGETGIVTIKLLDADGNISNNPFLIYGQPRRSLKTTPRISDSTGYATVTVQPFKSGKLKLRTRSIAVKRIDRVYGSLNIVVPEPKLQKIEITNLKNELYENVAFELKAQVFDEANLIRKDQKIIFTSTNDKVISVNQIGILSTHKPGKASVIASAGEISKKYNVKVLRNPVAELSLKTANKKIRTGDVEQLIAKAFDKRGRLIEKAPISFSYSGKADYGRGLPAHPWLLP